MPLGDGGPTYSGPVLTPNPNGMECGDIGISIPRDFTLEVDNLGDQILRISNVTANSTEITFPGLTLPINIVVGGNTIITIRINPQTPGLKSKEVTFTSNANNNPVLQEVVYTGIGSGVKALTVDPPEWSFDDTKVGSSTAEKLFTVRNTSDVVVTVSAYTVPADFLHGATNPALPQAIAVGGSYQFGIKFTPLGAGYAAENWMVTSDAAATPFLIACSGTGYLINPAYIITPGRSSLLMGFVNSSGTSAVKVPTNPISWDCEESGAFVTSVIMLPFQTDKGSIPGFSYEKQVMRVFFHYENLGIAIVNVQVTAMRGTVNNQDVTIGTVAADGKTMLGIADILVTDEIVEIQFLRITGPISIIDYLPKYLLKGERGKE